MDRRSFLSLLGLAPVAVPLVARGEVPVEPSAGRSPGGARAGGSGTVAFTNAVVERREAGEPIAAGDFVAVAPDGPWLVRAAAPSPEVVGVALAWASPGEMVAINVSGVARVNVEG